MDASALSAAADALAIADPQERFSAKPAPKLPRTKTNRPAGSQELSEAPGPDGTPAVTPQRKTARPSLELPEGFNGLETAQSWLALCVADIGKANSTATQLTGMQVAASVREEILARVKDLEAAYVKLRDAVEANETDNNKWRPLLEWVPQWAPACRAKQAKRRTGTQDIAAVAASAAGVVTVTLLLLLGKRDCYYCCSACAHASVNRDMLLEATPCSHTDKARCPTGPGRQLHALWRCNVTCRLATTSSTCQARRKPPRSSSAQWKRG